MSEPKAPGEFTEWRFLLPDNVDAKADNVGATAMQVTWEIQHAADLLGTSIRFRIRAMEPALTISRVVFSVWTGADTHEMSKMAVGISIDCLPDMPLSEYLGMLTLPQERLSPATRAQALLSIEGHQGEIKVLWTGRNEFNWKDL